MKKILGIMLLILLILPTAQAASCADPSTLQYDFPYEDDTGAHTLKINTTCPYGCDNGRCIDENSDSGMMFIVGVLGIAALFFYAAFKFEKEKHGHLQTLFFMFGLIMILVLVWIMFNYATIVGHPTMQSQFTTLLLVIVTLLIFMVAYVSLLLLVGSLKYLQDIAASKMKGKRK